MSKHAENYRSYSNSELVLEEVSHRRSIASYATSLTLSSVSAIATAGLTLPICGFKAYKIASHKCKLNTVRAELAKRHLSPADERNRDVLVPVAITFAVYVVTFGLAGIIDVMPSDVQGAFGVGESGGNKYEAFIIGEAVSPLSNAVMHSGDQTQAGYREAQ